MTTMATPTQSTPDAQVSDYNPRSESVTAKRAKSMLFHVVALVLTAVVLYPGLWMIAMSVLALLPVLIFFLVFQRYIVEGVSTQGLKG